MLRGDCGVTLIWGWKKLRTRTGRINKSLNAHWRLFAGLMGLAAIALACLGNSYFTSTARSGSLSPHKIHVTVSQLEYDPKAQSVEIVMRVFADDLENALSQMIKRQIKLDPDSARKDKVVGQNVLAYLRNTFELKSKAGRTVKLGWVGLEWQTDMFWLYFEGKLPANSGTLEGTQIRNKVFCDLYEDQVNIVNTKIQSKQIGFMFDPKDDFKVITLHVPGKPK